MWARTARPYGRGTGKYAGLKRRELVDFPLGLLDFHIKRVDHGCSFSSHGGEGQDEEVVLAGAYPMDAPAELGLGGPGINDLFSGFISVYAKK